MVHLGRSEGRVALVAAIAGRCCRNMRSGVFAQSVGVVVASRTAASRHTLMCEAGRLPRGRGMANIAGLGRHDVFHRLDLSIDLLISTGVAGQALAGRPGVSHFCRRKGGKGGVTSIALGAGWNMY